MSVADAIGAVEGATGLSPDAVQIYAAVLAQLLAAAVLRRSLAQPVPWLCALAVALAWQWAGGSKLPWPQGLTATMAIPTLLLVLVRFAPALLLRTDRKDD